MLSVENIKKDKKNAAQGFSYRGIDDIMNALHASFALEGVIIRVNEIRSIERVERPTKNGGTMLYSINDYQFCLSAPDGSHIMAWGRGEASDSADKSSNKAVSVALKYVLLQMFLIPTEEMVKNEADAYQNEIGGEAKKTAADIALESIRSATSRAQLEALWAGFSAALQKNQSIIDAVLKQQKSFVSRPEPAE